jgi:hypothetical protein
MSDRALPYFISLFASSSASEALGAPLFCFFTKVSPSVIDQGTKARNCEDPRPDLIPAFVSSGCRVLLPADIGYKFRGS